MKKGMVGDKTRVGGIGSLARSGVGANRDKGGQGQVREM